MYYHTDESSDISVCLAQWDYETALDAAHKGTSFFLLGPVGPLAHLVFSPQNQHFLPLKTIGP